MVGLNYRTAPKSCELDWLFPALVRNWGSRELQNIKGSRKWHLLRKKQKNFNQKRGKNWNKNNYKL